MSNQSDGNVRHLDTVNFQQTITAYANQIREFQAIRQNVDRITDNIVNTSRWRGLGRDAFDNDRRQVRANLNDISGIMYDMRDVLNKASNEYNTTDRELSKDFRAEG